MQFGEVNLLAVLAGVIGVLVVAFYFRKAHKARDDRFANRAERSMHEIFESHFSNCGVAEGRFVELWKELADILEVPAGKILPSDRFQIELAPPKGFEFNDQINDVMYMIGKRCQRAGFDPRSINSVRDYIITFGAQ